MSHDKDADQRVALVTGASRGLGAVLARFLRAQGFALVLNARETTALRSTARELPGDPLRVQTVPGDVSDLETRRALANAVRTLGGLDLLVNNASELGPSPLPKLAEVRASDWERVFRVNVLGPLLLVQELLPALRTRHGQVVNISSDAAVGGYAGWGTYGASKAALDLVSRTLANELRETGVSVVSVDPGDMRTAMHQAAFPGEDISDRPPPEVTLPFWAWLWNQDPRVVSGHRFRAQADRWEVPA